MSGPAMPDETHDAALRSWVDGAGHRQSDFPIQNLPFGVFRRGAANEAPRIGVRIGDAILDLHALGPSLTNLPDAMRAALRGQALNDVMGLPAEQRRAMRATLSSLLRAGGDLAARHRGAAEDALVRAGQVTMGLPAAIGTFVDFYACLDHATTAGRVLRKGEPAPLLPNWKWMPLGYHGRASSIQVGGAVVRPAGQVRPDRSQPPAFEPTRELDYEAELGAFVGPGCAKGRRVAMADAAGHIAGYVLVNDWSARDLQTWEGGPLGPLQSKSFATSISPWVVTSEALAPFRTAPYPRDDGDPEPLPHLDHPSDRAWGGLDIRLEAFVSTARMRAAGQPAQRISRASARGLYWTMQQILAHMASNGSGLAPGDLLASGTISGDAEGTRGCLLETTQRGRAPIQVGDETRAFLEDGDEVTLTARCERDGYVPIGFGECSGVIVPAPP